MMNFASFVVLATAIAGASAQVMVNTPTSVVACLPVQLTWSGGQAPYFVSLLPGGKPSATPLEDFGQQTGTSYVWKADLPAGTSVTIQIRDSQGQLNYSDQFNIQPGTSTCATSSGSGSSGTSTTSSTPATTTGTAAAGNTSASKTPTSTTTTTSTTNTTGSTPKTGATTGSTTGSTTPTTGSTGSAAGTSTNGTSASTDARSDASRTSAGVLAVAVACAVAVFA